MRCGIWKIPIYVDRFLAQWVWGEIRDAIQSGELGSHSLCELGVTLRESDVAWASYDAPLA